MYAVFEDGSRQYRVSEGDVVRVDYRDTDAGSRIEFDRVLLYQSGDETRIGQPLVEGMRVTAEVLGHPTEKTYIQKYRRRKTYRRFRGHRQPFTAVQIRSILLPGQEAPKEAAKKEEPAVKMEESAKKEEPAKKQEPTAKKETSAKKEEPAAKKEVK
jgi:large subunit ribosomal protein L21